MARIRFARLPEIAVDGRRLGRHIRHDEKSKDFAAERADGIVSVTHVANGLPLDQANVGACTAEAETGACNSEPNFTARKKKVLTQDDAYKLYGLETKNEGQPWLPNDPGGSGLEVCKAAVQLGLITSYTHAFGIQHALEALVLRPVITGISWYDSFDQPDTNGLVEIKKGAQVRGGHEVLPLRIIAEHELIGLANSWNVGYGVPDPELGMKGGVFYMSFSTWDELLKEQGDVTVPIV